MLFSCASASQTDNRHLVVPHCRRYYWSRGSTLHFEIPKWLFTKSTLSLKKEYKNKITEKCQIHPETRPYNTLATQCLGTVYLIISVILTGLILNLLYQGCFILFCQNIALFYSQKHTNMTQTHWEHKSIWKKKKKKWDSGIFRVHRACSFGTWSSSSPYIGSNIFLVCTASLCLYWPGCDLQQYNQIKNPAHSKLQAQRALTRSVSQHI